MVLKFTLNAFKKLVCTKKAQQCGLFSCVFCGYCCNLPTISNNNVNTKVNKSLQKKKGRRYDMAPPSYENLNLPYCKCKQKFTLTK